MDAKALDIKIEFQSAVTPFKGYLNFSDIPNLHPFYGIFSDSVLFFGLSDLNYREAERSKILDIDGDKVRFLNRRERQTNAQGIELLSSAIETFDKIKDEYKFNPEKLDNEEIIKELTEKFKLNISEFDVASKDVKQFYDDFLQAIEKVKEEGEIGAFNYIDTKLKELKKLRQQSDRGRQSNIPWWKIVAIAVYIGVAVWLMYKCAKHYQKTGNLNHWSCTAVSVSGGISLGVIKFIIAKFC